MILICINKLETNWKYEIRFCFKKSHKILSMNVYNLCLGASSFERRRARIAIAP